VQCLNIVREFRSKLPQDESQGRFVVVVVAVVVTVVVAVGVVSGHVFSAL
jgi:hypothetical protein